MIDLTDKQRLVYDYFVFFVKENLYYPSVRDIGRRFELTAKGAYDHLTSIARKGYLVNDNRRFYLPKNKFEVVERG